MSITSTAMQANAYTNAISPTVTAYTAGAVGGPAGGVQTGVATIQAVTTTGGTANAINLVGKTTLTPATTSTPATLTTTVSGVNPAGGGIPVSAIQTGTVTTTKPIESTEV